MKLNLSIKQSPEKYSSSRNVPNKLLSDHEWVVIQLRNDMGELATDNKDTSDFLAGLTEEYKGPPWVLRDT